MVHGMDIMYLNAAYYLRHKRLMLQKTQQEVSAETGINNTALSRLESGLHAFKPETIAKLLAYYQCRIEDVYRTYFKAPTLRAWKHLDQLEKKLLRQKRSGKRLKQKQHGQLAFAF